ncbi:MAG: aldolase/citrate lyase family protein [Pseudomonadota bacterium]
MLTDFRQRLLAGDNLIGTAISLESADTAELLSRLGFDWFFIDAEHAPLSPREVQHIIRAASPIPCVVRISRGDEVSIKRALDVGAAGIIVPRVNSAAQARLVVSFSKYPPQGSRGVGLSRAQTYGLSASEYFSQANQHTAVIVQAEHIDAVDAIDEICEVDGVDAVFVGPADLSASLERLGKLDDPLVVDAIARVTSASIANSMKLGYYAGDPGEAREKIAEGYSLMCCSTDIRLLADGATSLLTATRGE